jgi:hypothetical protein
VVKRKDAKTIIANYLEFKSLCRKVSLDDLPTFTILAESEENVSNILSPAV